MRTSKVFLFLLLFFITLSAFIFNSISPETKPTQPSSIPSYSNLPNVFLIGAFNGGYMPGSSHLSGLNFNVWDHSPNNNPDINGGTNNRGWIRHIPNDLLENDISVYRSAVEDLLDSNNDAGLYTLMHRIKIDQIGYGARSDYQCEGRSYIANSDLNFYCYTTSQTGANYTEAFNGETVKGRYCGFNNQTDMGEGWMSANYVVKDLYTNREQADMNSKYWIDDWPHTWLVKPRIRIDPDIVDNYPETQVCSLEVRNWDGDLVRSVEIKAKHFEDPLFPGSYNGAYIEEFFDLSTLPEFGMPPDNDEINPNHENPRDFSLSCGIDYRVYWYGNCEMWIDYVRVDNDIADKLFDPVINFNEQIREEVQDLACYNNSPIKFYIEEWEFNHLPCLAYLSRKLNEYSTGAGGCGRNINLMVALNYARMINLIPDKWDYHTPLDKYGWDFVKRYLLDSVQQTQVLLTNYPFLGSGVNIYSREDLPDPYESFIPNTLPSTSGGTILASAEGPADYDYWLQTEFDKTYDVNRDSYSSLEKMGDYLSKESNIPYMHMLQSHTVDWGAGKFKLREPTNEETEMMTNLAVSYGAKGIMYFEYFAYGCEEEGYVWGRGLANVDPGINCASAYNNDFNVVPRHDNVYTQNTGSLPVSKYEKIAATNLKLIKWGPTLMSFNNADRHSYIYRTERNDLISETYFRDLYTFKPGEINNVCVEDFSESFIAPEGLYGECKEDRYLQVATFEKSTNDGNNYFMVVNRRCSPYIDESDEDNRGGRRRIMVQFKPDQELSGFDNWSIFNVENGAFVKSFNKLTYHLVDLGWFDPGEGRLYKMAPTMKSGGLLVGDEDVSGETFTCEDTVYNDGFDITIDSGTTITFSDSASIIMAGGEFTSGSMSQLSSGFLNTFKAESGHKWNGLRFDHTVVKIYNSKFQDIASPCVNYAVKCIDPVIADIRSNEFVMSSDTSGGVSVTSITDIFSTSPTTGVYINYNTFTMNNSRTNAVSLQAFTDMTFPALIKNNTMTSNGYATGIFASFITGGVIGSNSITGFNKGMTLMYTTADVYGNTITNTTSASDGIFITDGSSLNMTFPSESVIGGFNVITNTYGASNNVHFVSSLYGIPEGCNTFDIGSSGLHLYGNFPETVLDAGDGNKMQYNCFKVEGTPATDISGFLHDITDGAETPSPFTYGYFENYCEFPSFSGSDIVDLGGGMYDTIPTLSGGIGETITNSKYVTSVPRVPAVVGTDTKPVTSDLRADTYSKTNPNTNPKSKIRNPKLKEAVHNNMAGGYRKFTLSPGTLYDTISSAMRRRDYASVKSSCYELIDAYPDSVQSLRLLSTLFLSVIATDTTTGGMTELKSFYEGLILNNSDNTGLVKNCNYMAQKCKVKLGHYSSAMSGFQAIVNANPYSYLGLLARWDYMAASLLLEGEGGGIGSADFGFVISDLQSDESYKSDESDESFYGDDDKSPYTREQRKVIRQSVNDALITTKRDDDRKIKIFEDRSEKGDVKSEKELNQMRSLKQIIKTEKPKNIAEHIKIVSGDIQHVFASTLSSDSKRTSIIPTVFSLSQNYPNPFNPVTTIKYALPNDVKVVIKIYDILGREVKTLVNEIQKAGYYDTKFNGANLASGVYFYRIEAGDFVQSKKMVLVK